MVVVAVWHLSNFFRKDDPEERRLREPSGKIGDYLTSAVLDPRWTRFKSTMRHSVETVLRGSRKDDRVVATLLVKFNTVGLAGTRESITLDTSDSIIDLEANIGIIWPWQLNPTSKTYEVVVDGERLGAIEVQPAEVVARDASGEVARWQTGEIPAMPYEGKEPRYGQLLGKASGSLRVPMRRLGGQLDFNDAPFYASAEGDERWLLVFLAIAASNSLLLQAR